MSSEQPRHTTSHPGPKSWADDLNSYREVRGSRSLSALSSRDAAPPRYSRTNRVPFAATTHPLFPYNDFTENQDRMRSDPQVLAERCNRHGWGDTSLLKEEGYAGVTHPRAEQKPAGKGQPEHSGGKDGRKDLFGILQCTEGSVPDSWIGHPKVDPTKGKGVVHPPTDPKGRRDLFDVLHARQPGVPSDDSWLGHTLVDPARGKARPMGPEERRGRRDLGEIYNQGILREPKARQAELLLRGMDPLQDGWIGHTLIDPSSGKAAVEGVAATKQVLHGSSFLPESAAAVAAAATARQTQLLNKMGPMDTMQSVLDGTADGANDWGTGGKRSLPESKGPCTLLRNDNLYGHMTFRSLSSNESRVLSKAFDDGRHHPRRTLLPPGSEGVGKGRDMTHFLPHQRVGVFVPYGGLAQEGRTTRQLPGAALPKFGNAEWK